MLTIDLNDSVVEPVRLKSILNVTLANNAQVADNFDGGRTKHMILFI